MFSEFIKTTRRCIADGVFFSHVGSLIETGRRKALEMPDLPELPETWNPRKCGDFKDLDLRGPYHFLYSVIRIARKPTLLSLILTLLGAACALAGPFLLHKLISLIPSISNSQDHLTQALLVAAGLCLASVAGAILFQHHIYQVLAAEQLVVNGLNFRIYRQALGLSRFERQKRAVGEVVNFMGTDSNAVSDFIPSLAYAIHSLVVIIAASFALFYFLEVAALAAFVIFFIMIPLTHAIGMRFIKIDHKIMEYRDERVTMLSQFLTCIRVIKYLVWEKPVIQEIEVIRGKEVAARKRLAITQSCAVIVYICASTLVGLACLGTYILLGNKLDAATIFATLSLLTLLEHPFGHMTHNIANFANAKVSADRIISFLKTQSDLSAKPRSELSENRSISIQIENLTARYEDASEPQLQDINLYIEAGESLLLIGPTGSGKTTFLQTLLGEAPTIKGKIHFEGLAEHEQPIFSYASQSAFVKNASIAENLSFGAHDKQDLDHALWLSAMDKDVRQLPGGLRTEIGEHGVNLSGGQKQRLSLARSYLASSHCVLLDDPLAAVDENTEDLLMERLIAGAWKSQTLVMTSHRLRHLRRFDKIAFLEDGRIKALGTYDELWQNSARFREFIQEQRHVKEVAQKEPSEKGRSEKSDEHSKTESRITDDEDRQKGKVAIDVYRRYIMNLCGDRSRIKTYMTASFLILTVLGVTYLPVLQNAWISIWVDHWDSDLINTGTQSASWLQNWLQPWLGNQRQNLMIFAAFAVLVIATNFVQYLFWSLRAVHVGKILHDRAFRSVMGAKIRFFDATPVGRILNRFSKDIDTAEGRLPWSFEAMVRSTVQSFASVVVVIALLPLMALIIAPVLVLYWSLQSRYRSSARELQRLWSITRSPRYEHFKETLHGLPVIRALQREQYFWQRFYETLATNQKAFHGLVMANRWFSIRIPLLSSAISLGVAFSICFLASQGSISSGIAGLLLVYALGFWDNLNWAVRTFAENESAMTSVERLQTYGHIPQEPDRISEDSEANLESWPQRGEIVFDKVSARYAKHLPQVIHKLSLHIPAGNRVGIVGRTGAGKSTLFQLLFRFMEVDEGTIMIDGVNINTIPRDQLRKAIGIIPQDPILLKGSVRKNLDRYDLYSNAQIWEILERIQLSQFIANLPGGLDYEVAESGANFSQGQRQLLCMARILLTNTPIVLMDEATASVDVETDFLIQKTIREGFRGRTMLIIAHRSETILDCDQIINLEAGSMRELNVPHYQRRPVSMDTSVGVEL